MSRERDVRNAIVNSLQQTGAFSEVAITGVPEQFGYGASDFTAASIEPIQTTFATGWDAAPSGSLDYNATCNVTLVARHQDAQLRDELAEQLLDYLCNVVNGRSIAGLTLPQKTMVTGWTWVAAQHPERRITASVNFTYLVQWNSFDVNE